MLFGQPLDDALEPGINGTVIYTQIGFIFFREHGQHDRHSSAMTLSSWCHFYKAFGVPHEAEITGYDTVSNSVMHPVTQSSFLISAVMTAEMAHVM
ncbi:hypothetical protein K6W36_17095 [Acetobacter senegalensis]|uniref:hypothetical protein n=1 Tax=Acetobacter senegalensis TaxID=446692 RepID=UPI001EDA90C4|nr:hypothetical protein [Acetobacter senegalensis]MCG4262269.1 hypothetical protein [Acetobacter senegalensis]